VVEGFVSTSDQSAAESESVVAAGRASIDAIDIEICQLIQRRREVSAGIQQARIMQGEPRISHTRENQVIAGYRERLGKPGVTICLAVLELSRGSGQ
jgi:chorismate mutase